MGGLIGEGLAEYRVGQAAGTKGLPEGFARFLGHDVLSVIAWHQHHDMAGALAAAVATMDFARFAQGCHTGVALEVGGAHHNLFHLALNSPFRGCVTA
ncbi:hypothetical protein D3C73_1371090 [compost metagenome]